MFASFDPVALDQACVDACLKQQPIPGSRLDEMPHVCDDHFINSQPATDWRSQLAHAEKIGLGTREYELIEMRYPGALPLDPTREGSALSGRSHEGPFGPLDTHSAMAGWVFPL